MIAREQLQQLGNNLIQLGARRLAILGIAGAAVFAVIAVGGYQLSKPELEMLYTGLTPSDISRIGAALEEAGIAFDVNAERTAVLVRHSQTARARMLLAERGLPRSASAGYELFDKLGSMGLTSFMQEVTRVRALEGEIARTVQAMKGVKAVRVHIVMPNEGSFRRRRQPPSASVVIRSDTGGGFSSAPAIRHLVASAVPGMTIDRVTVLGTDGSVLSSGDDGGASAPNKMVGLEQTVSANLQSNIRRTLAPYLGIANFEISVRARLNTDQQQVAKTEYDPESRVERSVRVVKETGKSENSQSSGNVGVEQNVPEPSASKSAGDISSQNKERREELTNYELNSKTTKTASNGYKIEKLSIAVVVNKERLAESIGGNADPKALSGQLDEVRRLVASAAGIDVSRGDLVAVSAVKFYNAERDMAPHPSPPITDYILKQTGGFIKAATFVVVTLMIIMLGLRPMARALNELPQAPQLTASAAPAQLPADGSPITQATATPQQSTPGSAGGNPPGQSSDLVSDVQQSMDRTPQKRLMQMIDLDEARAASVLKQWVHET